jgi:hypothetical protein
MAGGYHVGWHKLGAGVTAAHSDPSPSWGFPDTGEDGLGMVMHACNPSTSRQRQEDPQSKASLGSITKPGLKKRKIGLGCGFK